MGGRRQPPRTAVRRARPGALPRRRGRTATRRASSTGRSSCGAHATARVRASSTCTSWTRTCHAACPPASRALPVPGFDWRARFHPGGEPTFDREARHWARNEARDFTDADRRHFAAVYDTALAYLTTSSGGSSRISCRGPGLRQTLVVVVTADHGEELGEKGASRPAVASDAVQHIPLIVAGAGVQPDQRVASTTENVDDDADVLAVLGVRCRAASWSTAAADRRRPRASRFHHRLLRPRRIWARCGRDATCCVCTAPDTATARCDGVTLYRACHPPAGPIFEAPRASPLVRALARRIAQRLGERGTPTATRAIGPPAESMIVVAAFWMLDNATSLRCVPWRPRPRGALHGAGWSSSGRGVFVASARDVGTARGARGCPLGMQHRRGGRPVGTRALAVRFPRWLRRDLPARAAGRVSAARPASRAGCRVACPAHRRRGAEPPRRRSAGRAPAGVSPEGTDAGHACGRGAATTAAALGYVQ